MRNRLLMRTLNRRVAQLPRISQSPWNRLHRGDNDCYSCRQPVGEPEHAHAVGILESGRSLGRPNGMRRAQVVAPVREHAHREVLVTIHAQQTPRHLRSTTHAQTQASGRPIRLAQWRPEAHDDATASSIFAPRGPGPRHADWAQKTRRWRLFRAYPSPSADAYS